MIEEGDDEATPDLRRRAGYYRDHTMDTENGDSKALGRLPAMTTSTSTCADLARSQALAGNQETPCNRDSGENWIPVIIDWYITYHPTYRIPQLSFDASEQGE